MPRNLIGKSGGKDVPSSRVNMDFRVCRISMDEIRDTLTDLGVSTIGLDSSLHTIFTGRGVREERFSVPDTAPGFSLTRGAIFGIANRSQDPETIEREVNIRDYTHRVTMHLNPMEVGFIKAELEMSPRMWGEKYPISLEGARERD